MNPFYFGSGARRLFGIYSPAAGTARNARAIVICPPWGHEYIRAHRSMRQLAAMLAGAGCHVLRFDYYGTGDSAGEISEADLTGWQRDIEMAIEELKDTTGVARVQLAGLRLGATLAAAVAARQPRTVDALALWDPVQTGTGYLDELMAVASVRSATSRGPRNGAPRVIDGFPLPEKMVNEMRALDLAASMASFGGRTLAVFSGEAGDAERLRGALSGGTRGQVDVEHVPSTAAWVRDVALGTGAVPVNLLTRMVEWTR